MSSVIISSTRPSESIDPRMSSLLIIYYRPLLTLIQSLPAPIFLCDVLKIIRQFSHFEIAMVWHFHPAIMICKGLQCIYA